MKDYVKHVENRLFILTVVLFLCTSRRDVSLRVKYRMSSSPSPTPEFGSSVTTVRYV